eukprot:364869-Chlamydomonas_euryale.AAC.27
MSGVAGFRTSMWLSADSPFFLLSQFVTLAVTNCSFTSNRASNYGGGVECVGCDAAVFTNCSFTYNNAAAAGGLGLYEVRANAEIAANRKEHVSMALRYLASTPPKWMCHVWAPSDGVVLLLVGCGVSFISLFWNLCHLLACRSAHRH